ncbi:MAG TPA: lysylphosphatidylglycerol synthase transmembrane domain-containing protein [Solirubrobacteraceae bacterium]|nr:lysylphosphatidylglycerol synthase transmembrane domain-containing protein [Solirubrobacteraceae bacterium]
MTFDTKPDRASATTARIARRLVAPVILSAAIGSLVLAVPPLRGVAKDITHLRPEWVLAAIALEVGSCLGFVVIFRLFFDAVPPGAARELALTEQGSGALLPGGGVGALAVGGWLLRRTGMSTSSIIDRSSALFFLTSAVNVAALFGGGALLIAYQPFGGYDLLRAGVPIAGGLAAAAAVLAIPVVMRRSPRRRWPTWLVDLASGIVRARRSLLAPSWRLLGAGGYLGFDIAALGATFAATGHPLPVAPLVLGYLIGYLANLIPVPGGFGVLEGGLAGTLIAYGAPATQATAAVIVYHAIAFWVPSLGGLGAYALLRRRLRAADAATQRSAPSRRSVAPSGMPPKYASSTCPKIGLAESA